MQIRMAKARSLEYTHRQRHACASLEDCSSNVTEQLGVFKACKLATTNKHGERTCGANLGASTAALSTLIVRQIIAMRGQSQQQTHDKERTKNVMTPVPKSSIGRLSVGLCSRHTDSIFPVDRPATSLVRSDVAGRPTGRHKCPPRTLGTKFDRTGAHEGYLRDQSIPSRQPGDG